MRFLISNDDGYLAPGLKALADALAKLGEIVVVAPDRDRSGASNSLTLDRPIRTSIAENGFIHVSGTPTDCVHLAVSGLLDYEPDIVVSGINSGANMGDDTLYSGTVAAAMEGRFLGLPSIAISLALRDQSATRSYYDTAGKVAAKLVGRLDALELPPTTILNVNVPDVPYESLSGIRVTRLGQRHRSEPIVKAFDPRQRRIYWIGPPGDEQDAGPGTDFRAVRDGFVSVTPLTVDLTYTGGMPQTGAWTEGIEL